MKIENYREGSPTDKYVAIFDIHWPAQFGMVFKNWKLIRGKKGDFLAGPSFMVETNGEKKFYQYIEFTQEKKKDFEEKVKALLAPFMNESIPNF